jgi:prepilin-type processing-associated H-X9-DG protein
MQFGRGASQMPLFVEVNSDFAVTWTQPDDYFFDPDSPWIDLGAVYPGGFNVAFADGGSDFILSSTSDDDLARLFNYRPPAEGAAADEH